MLSQAFVKACNCIEFGSHCWSNHQSKWQCPSAHRSEFWNNDDWFISIWHGPVYRHTAPRNPTLSFYLDWSTGNNMEQTPRQRFLLTNSSENTCSSRKEWLEDTFVGECVLRQSKTLMRRPAGWFWIRLVKHINFGRFTNQFKYASSDSKQTNRFTYY